MKKLMFVSFLIIIASFVKAQGNLQFNRAVYLNISGTQTPSLTTPNVVFKDTIVTVPSGKVWKVESANVTIQNGSSSFGIPIVPPSSGNGAYLLLNNNIISSRETMQNLTTYEIRFPIWLPQGNYPIKLSGSFANQYYTLNCFGGISILEFNIIE